MTVDGRHHEVRHRVDAGGQDQVVDERDDRRGRHLGLEADRDVDDDRDEEDHQALQRLVRDLLAPGGADVLRSDVVGIDLEALGEPVLTLVFIR